MHTGRSSQTTACCGASAHAVVLTADDAPAVVELVRCTSCGTSAWQVDRRAVSRDDALAVLADAFGPGSQRPRPVHRATARRGPARSRTTGGDTADARTELADLLTGWQVFGTTA